MIDSFVDTTKIDAAIATGTRVVLLFSSYHDMNNTMESELNTFAVFREKVQASCVCIDYKNSAVFEQRFTDYLNSVNTK